MITNQLGKGNRIVREWDRKAAVLARNVGNVRSDSFSMDLGLIMPKLCTHQPFDTHDACCDKGGD